MGPLGIFLTAVIGRPIAVYLAKLDAEAGVIDSVDDEDDEIYLNRVSEFSKIDDAVSVQQKAELRQSHSHSVMSGSYQLQSEVISSLINDESIRNSSSYNPPVQNL